jgi:hypothetical protein
MRRIERLGIAARPPRTSTGHLVSWAVASTVLGALFPRTAHRLRWVARARPRVVALYVVAFAAFNFGVDALMRSIARGGREQIELREQLAEELGRDPTDDEVRRRWMELHGYGDARPGG